MKKYWFLFLMILSVLISALAVPYLSEGGALALILLPVGIGVFSLAIIIIQTKAVRKANSWKEAFTWGLLVYEHSNCNKPIRFYWPVKLLLISGSILLGVIIGLLLLNNT